MPNRRRPTTPARLSCTCVARPTSPVRSLESRAATRDTSSSRPRTQRSSAGALPAVDRRSRPRRPVPGGWWVVRWVGSRHRRRVRAAGARRDRRQLPRDARSGRRRGRLRASRRDRHVRALNLVQRATRSTRGRCFRADAALAIVRFCDRKARAREERVEMRDEVGPRRYVPTRDLTPGCVRVERERSVQRPSEPAWPACRSSRP